jgi:hypothetical protein
LDKEKLALIAILSSSPTSSGRATPLTARPARLQQPAASKLIALTNIFFGQIQFRQQATPACGDSRNWFSKEASSKWLIVSIRCEMLTSLIYARHKLPRPAHFVQLPSDSVKSKDL